MNFYKAVCKLSNIQRFAGASLTRHTSGACHSFRVIHLSMLIADEYNANPINTDKVNVELLLRASALHDLEEAEMGDIKSPVKNYPGIKTLYNKAAEEVMVNEILNDVPVNKDLYLKLWKEDKEGLSGEILQMADSLEALLTCAYELALGNVDLQKAFLNIRPKFNEEKYKGFLKKFPLALRLLKEADQAVESKIKLPPLDLI
jgi:5'-deoxynucleotidase YfbR-like HD superfamily hydrolase